MSNVEIGFMIALVVISVTIEIMSISMMLDIYKFKKMIQKDQEEIAEALMRIQKARFKEAIENKSIKKEQKKFKEKLEEFKTWENHIPRLD